MLDIKGTLQLPEQTIYCLICFAEIKIVLRENMVSLIPTSSFLMFIFPMKQSYNNHSFIYGLFNMQGITWTTSGKDFLGPANNKTYGIQFISAKKVTTIQ